jgi:hypothetical protein
MPGAAAVASSVWFDNVISISSGALPTDQVGYAFRQKSNGAPAKQRDQNPIHGGQRLWCGYKMMALGWASPILNATSDKPSTAKKRENAANKQSANDHSERARLLNLSGLFHRCTPRDVERQNSPTAAGNGRCQRMQRPKNPAHRNCNAWRQFGAVIWFGDIGIFQNVVNTVCCVEGVRRISARTPLCGVLELPRTLPASETDTEISPSASVFLKEQTISWPVA